MPASAPSEIQMQCIVLALKENLLPNAQSNWCDTVFLGNEMGKLLALLFLCGIGMGTSPNVSGEDWPSVVVNGSRSGSGLAQDQLDRLRQLMAAPPVPPPSVISIDPDGPNPNCERERDKLRRSQCSLSGDPESNPLNFNPNLYDAGTGLNKALAWTKETYAYRPAANRFLASLLAYESRLTRGGTPADYGGSLLSDLVDACQEQGANGSFNPPFFACVSAAKALGTEVAHTIDPVTKQGILDRLAGAIGKVVDGSGSVGGSVGVKGSSIDWSVNLQNANNSLMRHHQYLLREKNCMELRLSVMLTCEVS